MKQSKLIHLKSFCAYWPYPPIGGGPSRIYNLNNSISKEINITQYSFRPTNSSKIHFSNFLSPSEVYLTDNYKELQYLNPSCLLSSYLLSKINLPHDIFQSNILKYTGPKIDFNADLLQVEHPWLFRYVFNNNKKRIPIILTAHNYEYNLSQDLILKKTPYFKVFLKNIKKLEIDSLKKSDAVFSVSPRDIDQFIENGIAEEKIHLVPNGVDTTRFSVINEDKKQALKEKYGFFGKKIVLFTGTIHYPNIEAVNIIEKIAKQFNENVIFLVVGKAGIGFKSKSNFVCKGFVDDVMDYIKMADAGINPLISGSGTNLKMLEYLSSGLPTLTTPIGARGLDLENMEDALISNVDNMSESLNLLLGDENLCSKLKINGRRLVEKKYDWNIIGEKMIRVYKDLVVF